MSIIFAIFMRKQFLIKEICLQIEIKHFWCKFNDIHFIFYHRFLQKNAFMVLKNANECNLIHNPVTDSIIVLISHYFKKLNSFDNSC